MIRALWEKIEKELQALQKELRQDLPKEINKALAMGDLRENAEYQMALERQSYVQARMAQLTSRLADLSTVNFNDIPKDKVGIGSTVRLLDLKSEKEVTYEIVMNDDSDIDKGRISVGSPIARGLAGREEGDEVEIRIPSGMRHFEVLELKTLHDKETKQTKESGEK